MKHGDLCNSEMEYCGMYNKKDGNIKSLYVVTCGNKISRILKKKSQITH